MKPQPHRKAESHRDANGSFQEARSLSERGAQTTSEGSSTVITHRRYPSLCDDGQPYFPRWQGGRRMKDEATIADRHSLENEQSGFLWVRLIAVVTIIVIMAALAASM